MLAEHDMVVDGQRYEKGQDVPDLGNLVCVEVIGNKRKYQGYTEDKLKLPKYDNLGDGSSATLIDPNGVEKTIIAKYYATPKQWLDMRGGVIV